MPANSVLPATALGYEQWAAQWPKTSRMRSSARQGWNARQPEIDALREREQRLVAMLIKVEWLTDIPLDERTAFCVLCNGSKPHHVPGCKLGELLAAKEG